MSGRDKNGRFIAGERAAKEIGAMGGKTTKRLGKIHPLTFEHRSRGGKNSRKGEK